MNISKTTILLFSLCTFNAIAGESVVIEPLEKKLPKMLAGAKKSDKVSLIGTLNTIPMLGAKTTIKSTNYGQVILFSPMELDLAVGKKIEDLEAANATVKVTATMLTICSDLELKAEIQGCRWLDIRKKLQLRNSDQTTVLAFDAVFGSN